MLYICLEGLEKCYEKHVRITRFQTKNRTLDVLSTQQELTRHLCPAISRSWTACCYWQMGTRLLFLWQ